MAQHGDDGGYHQVAARERYMGPMVQEGHPFLDGLHHQSRRERLTRAMWTKTKQHCLEGVDDAGCQTFRCSRVHISIA